MNAGTCVTYSVWEEIIKEVLLTEGGNIESYFKILVNFKLLYVEKFPSLDNQQQRRFIYQHYFHDLKLFIFFTITPCDVLINFHSPRIYFPHSDASAIFV